MHDCDAHRDLVFALVAETRRAQTGPAADEAEAEARRAEVFDLAGVARDHLPDAVAAALTVPLAHGLAGRFTFAPDGYWRGETHRLCDRPGGLIRLVDETDRPRRRADRAGVARAPESTGPHTLAPPRLDGRGRLGEYLQSSEAAVVRDCWMTIRPAGLRMFVVRPAHNPVGPFDFGGGFDDRSHRRQPLTELMAAATRTPTTVHRAGVGASGERLGRLKTSRAAK